MGANEEQMNMVAHSGMDAVAYILILYSLAFLLFLFVNLLIHVYDRSANATLFKPTVNGRAPASRPAEDRQLREAGEFELEGLMSEDEDEEEAARRKLLKDPEENGFASPSTVGRNSDRVA
jgi:hypothetical protein